jgi:hypothetical protein
MTKHQNERSHDRELRVHTKDLPGTWHQPSSSIAQSRSLYARWLFPFIFGCVVLIVAGVVGYAWRGASSELFVASVIQIHRIGKADLSVQSSIPFEARIPSWTLLGVHDYRIMREKQQADYYIDYDSWSPDSSRLIVFERDKYEANINHDVIRPLVLSADGHVTHQFVEQVSRSQSTKLTWLRSSEVIVHTQDPFLLRLDGDREERMALFDSSIVREDVHSWAISPRGRSLLVVMRDGNILFFDRDSQMRKDLGKFVASFDDDTSSLPVYIYPQWSPDERLIAFFDASRAEKYARDPRFDIVPVAVVDAESLVFEDMRDVGQGLLVSGQSAKLLWSSDSRMITEPFGQTVMDVELDSDSDRPLLPIADSFAHMVTRWSTNGHMLRKVFYDSSPFYVDIVVRGFDEQQTFHHVARIHGGKEQVGQLSTIWADWLGDSKRVVFVLDRHIWIADIDLMTYQRVDVPDDDYNRVIASPDGRQLAFTTPDRVGIITLETVPRAAIEEGISTEVVDEVNE